MPQKNIEYNMKKIIFILTLALFTNIALATQPNIKVGLHMFSYHDRNGYNNFNPGLYLRYGPWTIGTYENSLNKNSTYIGYTLELPLKEKFIDSLDLTLGIITGYPTQIGNTGITPLVVPSVRIDLTDKKSLRVLYIPRVRNLTDVNVIHVSLEKSF